MPKQFYLAKSCVFVCKGMWWIYCCIWVVGIALTASLWPHYYFTSDFSVKSSFGLFVFMAVLFNFFYLLPSDTAGKFCSVWNMILKSFTHLNFRMTEKKTEKTNILSILNVLTLVKMNKLQIIAFFNHKQCIYDRFHINFWKTKVYRSIYECLAYMHS